MDKTEELKTDISEILRGATNNKIVLTATLCSVIMEKIEQYAQQVSREIAFKAWMAGISQGAESDLSKQITFDEWIKNQ